MIAGAHRRSRRWAGVTGRLLAALSLGVVAAGASAHKPSDAYLELAPEGRRIELRWDIALRDLDAALDLDADRDGRLAWGEVRARSAEIAALTVSSLSLRTEAGECALAVASGSAGSMPTGPMPAGAALAGSAPVGDPARAGDRARAGDPALALQRHSDGMYAVLRLWARCAAPADRVSLSYRLFAHLDPTHRGIVRVRGTERGAVLAPDAAPAWLPLRADAPAAVAGAGLGSFVATGIHHILIGWDHLAFLAALLLPSVLERRAGRWVPSDDLRASLLQVLGIVTAFTVAHSITLALAALQWVTPPPRLVEAAIAASVALAALDNVVPLAAARRWQIAFGFGLVHGFGFAAALADAGFARGAFAWALLGFNLGVEIGQIGIVALVLPPIWWLRRSRLYPRAAMPALSMLLALAGGAWFLDRVFQWRLLPI